MVRQPTLKPPSRIIETSRLMLRPHQPSDVPALVEMDCDPEVMRFISHGVQPDPVAHTAKATADVQRQLEHPRDDYGWWAIEERDTPRYLGWVILKPLPESAWFEVGYRLPVHAWGRGIATEAARAVVEHALTDLGLREIVSVTDPDHVGSQRVLKKCGLTRVGPAHFYGMPVTLFRRSV